MNSGVERKRWAMGPGFEICVDLLAGTYPPSHCTAACNKMTKEELEYRKQ